MVWSWAVTSLNVLGRLIQVSIAVSGGVLGKIGLLFLDPRLYPSMLVRLFVGSAGCCPVGSGGLSGLEVEEVGHQEGWQVLAISI